MLFFLEKFLDGREFRFTRNGVFLCCYLIVKRYVFIESGDNVSLIFFKENGVFFEEYVFKEKVIYFILVYRYY